MEQNISSLPLFCEPSINLATGRVHDRGGDAVMLYGAQALRVWVYKALHPQSVRYAYTAHTPDYGNELDTLSGRSLDALRDRVKRMVEDCLLVNPYLRSVEDFSVRQEGAHMVASFRVVTIYGDIDYEREVL